MRTAILSQPSRGRVFDLSGVYLQRDFRGFEYLYDPFHQSGVYRDQDECQARESIAPDSGGIIAALLIEQKGIYGKFAKALCVELKHGIKDGVRLAYRPPYHYDGHCTGVEALLRWEHPVYGMIYPPLVVKPAQDGEFLPDLEEAVLIQALSDRPRILERFGENVKLSVNVTGNTIVTDRYLQFSRRLFVMPQKQ